MKEAIVHKGPVVEIVDSPIPEPGPDDVVTKVVISGTNPKDWYNNYASVETFESLIRLIQSN